MNPQVLIVEDVTFIALDIADRLTTWGYGIIGPFDSGKETMDHLAEQKLQPDLAILDIEIKGDYDGISLAYKLIKKWDLPVIFLTKKEDDITLERILKISSCTYLNKPFGNNELRVAINNALKTKDRPRVEITSSDGEFKDRFFVKNGTGSYPIFVDKIVYIKSHGEVSQLFQEDDENPITVSGNLGRIEEKLSASGIFQRVSRFHIINLQRVTRINSSSNDTVGKKEKSRKFLKLSGTSAIIPLSEKYKAAVYEKLDFL